MKKINFFLIIVSLTIFAVNISPVYASGSYIPNWVLPTTTGVDAMYKQDGEDVAAVSSWLIVFNAVLVQYRYGDIVEEVQIFDANGISYTAIGKKGDFRVISFIKKFMEENNKKFFVSTSRQPFGDVSNYTNQTINFMDITYTLPKGGEPLSVYIWRFPKNYKDSKELDKLKGGEEE